MNYSDFNPNATGLDLKIELLKKGLAGLPIKGTVYGRVHRIEDSSGRWIPAIFNSATHNYEPLTPDDTDDPMVLIYPHGSAQLKEEYTNQTSNIFKTTVDIIFFGDHTRLFDSIARNTINTNILTTVFINKLKQVDDFVLESFVENTEDVYSMFRFDFEDKYYYHPFICFRIRGELHFEDSGNSEVALATLGLTKEDVKFYDPC